MKIWSWRHAVAQGKIEALTKLVLYTLANYMNETGGGCFPSIDTIMEDSGLARATVIKHLDNAEAAGFIQRRKHGYGGQKWARNEYTATFPPDCEIGAAHDLELKSQKGGSSGELPSVKAVQPASEGSSNDAVKAVHPVNSNRPGNTPDTSPVSASGEAGASAPPGDPPAMDFKKVLFTEGLKLLGGDTGSNRSLVGSWIRDYGESAVVLAMMEAQKQSAVAPKDYIIKTLKNGGKKHGNERGPGRFAEQDYGANTSGFVTP